MKPIVVHVSAEVSPFHKSGGLGDVLSGLPPALARAGLDVRVVTPRYPNVTNLASIGGEKALKPWPVEIDCSLGGNELKARVFEARTHGGDVTTYFVDAPHLSRGGLYGYGDDAYRFAILSRASIAVASVLKRSKNVGRLACIHAHDWHAALAVFYAKALPTSARGVPAIFTIHNLAFQGVTDASFAPYVDVPWDAFHATFEHGGAMNLMKGALLAADRVTTVSPTYAHEIQTRQYGHGLDGLLRYVSFKLRGLLNGIDTKSWNPATDRHLPATYTADSLEAKETCKEALRWELGLENRDDAPIVGAVSRLTSQKGIDWLCDVASEIAHAGGQLAILGEGEEHLEHRLHWLQVGHRGQVAYRRAFDDGLARRIYAGSDLFAMPSRFEPCGLAQMYAMRYGSIPVARATGGLVDTIRPLHAVHDVGGATGVLYNGGDAASLERALRWGMQLSRDGAALAHVRRNAMAEDNSWDHAARDYLAMYHELGIDAVPHVTRGSDRA